MKVTRPPGPSERTTRSLTDCFGRQHTYLRISVTDRCNLRCRYCMPPQGIEVRRKADILTLTEIERLCHVFATLGISKVRLTGGEPLVRKDLPQLVRGIAGIPGIATVGMTTNGVLLCRYLDCLKAAGLTRLNISLDTLRRNRFEQIALRQAFDDVLTGVQAALEAGFESLKLNVVIMRGVNDDELLDFVAFAYDHAVHVRFIEYMPFRSNRWHAGLFIPFAEMKTRIESQFTLRPVQATPSDTVSKDYAIAGGIGKVGFIASMSHDFCDTCNRVRLLANGAFKSCLFHAPEVNLRGALRSGVSDAAIAELIEAAIAQKQMRHQPMQVLTRIENSSMIEIGG